MDKLKHDSGDFNSLNILQFLFKWRKTLLIIAVAAIVVSSIVSLTIRPKYKSTVILFPATTSSISKALLSETNFKNDDVLAFGAEEEAEQMLQILNSDEVRSRVSEKYNLMAHYGIDANDKFKRTKLFEEFQSNITFKRTEYMSVKIEVMDIDPDTAALIANDIASLHDSTKIRMQKERAVQALNIVKREYNEKEAQIKSMADSVKMLNNLGLYDYESQSEVTTEQYAIALSKGDQRAVKALEEKLKIIATYGSAYVSLRDNLELQRKQLNLLKTKYEGAKADAEQFLPQKFVVSNAFPAEKKSYPVRWLIVVVATITTLLMSVIFILLFENYKQFNTNK